MSLAVQTSDSMAYAVLGLGGIVAFGFVVIAAMRSR